MPELLEHGGEVWLWGGWSITLPASYHQRNEDGSWSAWGADWTVDVHIVEMNGPDGTPMAPRDVLGSNRKANISGIGWIGASEVLEETDNGRNVYRLAGKLAACNTFMSCWVSYISEERHSFAENLIGGIAHHVPGAA